jgi:hypothetical protein
MLGSASPFQAGVRRVPDGARRGLSKPPAVNRTEHRYFVKTADPEVVHSTPERPNNSVGLATTLRKALSSPAYSGKRSEGR